MSREVIQAEFVDPNEIRVDRLLVNGARHFTSALEKQVGVPIWERGLGSIVEAFVDQHGIPKNPVTPVSLARMLGILK